MHIYTSGVQAVLLLAQRVNHLTLLDEPGAHVWGNRSRRNILPGSVLLVPTLALA